MPFGGKTACESLLLLAYGYETKHVRPGAQVDRDELRQIDLRWHDLGHEGACRLLGDGVDIRIIQLMLATEASRRRSGTSPTALGVHRFVAGVARDSDGLDGPSSSATVK